MSDDGKNVCTVRLLLMHMEQVGVMRFIDFEETLDRDLGKVGTPKRDEFERKVDESVRANR